LHVENARSRDERNVERRLSIPKAEQDLDGLGYLQGRSISDINEAALVGTRLAHSDGGVPTLELKLSQLDEEGLGELIAFFEISCGISGALLGVNPYDQPGVEAYKKNLFALLGKPGFEELGETLKSRL
jgi:glucose-6-phosphate isomerase